MEGCDGRRMFGKREARGERDLTFLWPSFLWSMCADRVLWRVEDVAENQRKKAGCDGRTAKR